MLAAWARRNCRQLVSACRSGAGGIPRRLRIRRIVEAPTRWPSLSSSPWILMYPQLGFSYAIGTTSTVRTSLIGGRPESWSVDRALRSPARPVAAPDRAPAPGTPRPEGVPGSSSGPSHHICGGAGRVCHETAWPRSRRSAAAALRSPRRRSARTGAGTGSCGLKLCTRVRASDVLSDASCDLLSSSYRHRLRFAGPLQLCLIRTTVSGP